MNISNFKKLFFACLIPSIFFVVSMITLKDYGISWDEPLHFSRGQAYFHYYLTGSKNYSDLEVNYRRSYYQQNGLNAEYFFKNDSAHPPVNDILAASLNYIFYQKLGIMGDIESLHLFNVLVSTLLILVVCLFAIETIGLSGMSISGLIMSCYPLFFAESHFNIKDPAETAFILLTLYLFWKSLEKFDWKILFFALISAGLAFGTKFNIVFLPFIISPYLVVRFWKKIPKIPNRYLLILLLSPIIIFFVLYVFWPYLWNDPLKNFTEAVRYYKEIGTGVNNYQKKFIILGGFNLFPISWVIITTPPIVLFLGLVGIFASLRFKSNNHEKTEILWLSLFLVTILRITIPGMSVYGGIRQVMEFLPGLALLSGLGFTYIVQKLKLYNYYNYLLIIIVFIILLIPIVKFHPNENVYFNFLIGGLSGAKEKHIPYWGNSFGNAYLQAVIWLNKNAEKNSKLALVQGTSPNIPKILLRGDISFSNGYWSGIDKKGEYLIELTHDDPIRAYPYVWGYVENFLIPVYEVKVDGVAIAKVWKNDRAYTKNGFKDELVLSTNRYNFEITKNILKVNFKSTEKVTRVKVSFIPFENCQKPKGYVETLNLSGKWIKLSEPIPSLQMERAYLEREFNYYFLAEQVKDMRFNMDNSNSCIFNNPKVVVNVLK